MAKYTIKFQIEGAVHFPHIMLDTFEDLLKVAILPVIGAELVPLTLEIKKARK
jgi:hypothetical protein